MRTKIFILIGLMIEVVSIIATGVSAWLVSEAEAQRAAVAFERQVDRGMAAASARMKTYELALVAGAGLFNASDSVERAEWRAFVETLDIDSNYPGISGFGFIRNLPADRIGAYTAQVRVEVPAFSIKILNRVGPGNRHIIELIEPLERNLPALGLDTGSNPLRRRAALAAMDSGSAQISNHIILVQDQDKKPGFLMMWPVYDCGTTPATIAERRERCIGWTYAPFVGEEVMAGIDRVAGDGINFTIYDGAVDNEAMIYDGIRGREAVLRERREVQIGNQQWVFVWIATDRILAGGDAWWVILIGLATSTGLLVVMLLLHRSAHQALTAQRTAQQDLELRNRDLHEARERAEQLAVEAHSANVAKSQFLAQMSHELRTPLNAIIGFSRQLAKRTDGRTQQGLERIHSNGAHLLELINSLLDLARIEAGKMDLQLGTVDLREIGEGVVEALESLARDRGLELTAHWDADLEPIRGDATKIRQILTNLVGNALKFTTAGSVRLHGGLHEDARLGRCAVLAISDTGPGIAREDQERLFRPFERLELQSGSPSSGLGLAISNKFADLHGGRIDCDSAPGRGATFTVLLPVYGPEAI